MLTFLLYAGFAFLVGTQSLGLGIAIASLLPLFFYVWLVRRKNKLAAINVELLDDGFRIRRVFDGPRWFNQTTTRTYDVRDLMSAHWITRGLVFQLRMQLGVGCMPIGVFRTSDDLTALYAWAEHHGITIEGPPPIPGAYVRSVE